MSQPSLPPLPPDTPAAAASEAAALGWMQGAPPARGRQIRFADQEMLRFPQLRWSFAHLRELIPTARVWRGDAGVSGPPHAPRDDIDAVLFTPMAAPAGATMSWAESLAANYTDGIVVLHEGRLVYERYFGGFDAHRTHACWSVTKSLVGTLAAVLVHEGRIDAASPVPRYVPELSASGWATASVQQVMDMLCALDFDENYAAPDSAINRYARAAGMLPRAPGDTSPDTISGFLPTVGARGTHGQVFDYLTVNTDVLAWIIQRVTGVSLIEAFGHMLWQPLRCEEDGEFAIDLAGTGYAGGGYCCTTRDMARFGQMMLGEGGLDGRRVIPAEVVAKIRRGGDPTRFVPAGYTQLPGWSYGTMWWHTHNVHGAYMARGIHGQNIYIDPKARMVIARHASHPGSFSAYNDPTTLPAYHALALHLMTQV